MIRKKKICVIGTGGHAASCIDLIESTKKFKIVGVISKKNEMTTKDKFLSDYNIVGNDDDYKKILKLCNNLALGISFYKNLSLREKLFNKFKKMGFNFPAICSPRSYISRNVKIGEGTQIFHGVTINKNSRVGKNCIINSHSLIEHDVRLGNNTQISTGVIINGGCNINKNSFIGSASILKENISIKEQSFIKMGSIIKK